MSLKSFSVCSFKENKVGDFNRDDEKRVWAAGKLSTTLSTNKMNDAQSPLSFSILEKGEVEHCFTRKKECTPSVLRLYSITGCRAEIIIKTWISLL